MENIRVVDNIVREAENLISEFYKDEDTSFVFTADHGMSAIGNHGDGRTFLPYHYTLIHIVSNTNIRPR